MAQNKIDTTIQIPTNTKPKRKKTLKRYRGILLVTMCLGILLVACCTSLIQSDFCHEDNMCQYILFAITLASATITLISLWAFMVFTLIFYDDKKHHEKE